MSKFRNSGLMIAVLTALAVANVDELHARDPFGPTRTVFRTVGGSTFVDQGRGNWTENRDFGPSSQFIEVHRDARAIDLLDRDRSMLVRLLSDRGLWRSTNGGGWAPWHDSNGYWVQ